MGFTGIRKSRLFMIMGLALGLSCLGLIACGGGESQSGEAAAESASPSAEQPPGKEKLPAGGPAAKAPAGWKTDTIQEWTVSFPPNWNKDPDTEIWQPGEVGPFRGRPATSVHIGGIPVMPPASFEERVKVRTGGEFTERVNVTVAGYSGFRCTWQQRDKKNRGLFLEEKVGGMIVIHFFDCQAPADEFDQYKADFEKILDSVRK